MTILLTQRKTSLSRNGYCLCSRRPKCQRKQRAEQQERFQRGEGGNLNPVLCVDKLPEEVNDFQVLLQESQHTGVDWDIAFAASMSGLIGVPPTPEQADQPLKMMVEKH